MAEVLVKNLTKHYGTVTAVSDVTLDIQDKEFVVLVGPSGCGKSTTLRMIAGLESITSGELFIGKKLVNALPSKDRDIAMVFQNYALYPHMTVFQNMAFGLKIKKVPKGEIEKRVNEAAAIVGLTAFLKRKPGTLSGGQRQRVALGRAIVRNPKVFLFDEPLSNLDAKLRVQMRIEITRLQRKLGVTTIYVTHDQTEAMTMADRIAVMKDGLLQQFDTPMNTYHQPANLFVAGFIGSPAMNFIAGEINNQSVFTDDTNSISLDLQAYRPAGVATGKWIIGIRPEDIHGDNGLNIGSYEAFKTYVEAVEPLGSDSYLYGKIGEKDFIARLRPENRVEVQKEATLYVDRSRIHYFHPGSGTRIQA
ncbi:MAG TPA: sn-glycerol-3-phosphate ABC transporter ATP-binding protein UgpC [Saprospiraceae bacterium]|nr:sn-glycerol-3-phosphate ABC transporter ATP-binding protein UgpC [Saprospiraceae bacterium]